MRMMKSSMVRTFFLWKENVDEIVHNRHVVSKFVNRMKMSGASRAIVKWRELVHTRQRLRKFINKMVGGKRSMLLLSGFNSWNMYTKNHQSNHLEKAVEELEEICKEQTSKMQAQMDQIEELEEHIRSAMGVQTEKAVRVIHKMINSKINSAFNSWIDHIELLKRNEALMLKIANRIRYRGVSMSIASWRAYTKKR